MSTYQRYQQARDAAWKTLIACHVSSLPVDARAVAAQLGVEILPYPGAEDRLGRLAEKAGGGSCRSLRIQGKWHIFIRENVLDDQHIHFSIAHEIGHIILRHDTAFLAPGVRAFLSRENQGDVIEEPLDLSDYAADIFAIRLLAPACVLHALGLRSREDMMRICGLPPNAAALRAERMGLLRERNLFLSHPLERQVHEQFLPFIRKENTPLLPHLEIPLPEPPPSPWRERLAALTLSDAPVERHAAESRFIPPEPETPSQPERKGRKGIILFLAGCGLITLAAALYLLFT